MVHFMDNSLQLLITGHFKNDDCQLGYTMFFPGKEEQE
jgi:hypothetical protein